MAHRRHTVEAAAAALLLLVSVAAEAQVPVRPEWAEGIPGWGRLRAAQRARSDLGRRVWARGLVVAQDAKDRIHVLDPGEGTVTVYSPEGERLEEFRPEGWEPLAPLPSLRGFATDARGGLYAAASRQTVVVFDRDRVLWRAAIPTFVTGVALDGSTPVVARIPARLSGDAPGLAEREDRLLAWLDEDGEVRSEAVPAEGARGPDALSVAFSQRLLVASEPGGDTLWVVDQTRRYRVRRLSSSGSVRASWISDREVAPARFGAPDAAMREEAARRGMEEASIRPVDAPELVRDIRARDGMLWVLARIEGRSLTVVDTFDADLEGPILRLALEAPWPIRQLAVTADGLWVFPPDDRGTPRYTERLPDWQLRELAAGAPWPGTDEEPTGG